MRSELRQLRELCSLIADCPHSTPVWTDKGYIVIRNQNIKNGRLDLSSPSFTDAEHFAHRIRRAKPTAGDIVFTREAPMGEVCMIPRGLECCVGQRQVLLRPNLAVVDGRFLLFALQSPQVQHEISWSEGTGSTVSNVRIPVLEGLRIPTPPLQTQVEIGEVLGALDDRIDLLRLTNATLESIAQALFKSWFIDFDPVRAKAEGREPEGMDAATAALFPAEFEESTLGLIPKGWQIGGLLDHASLLSGGTPRTSQADYWGGSIPWASAKDVSQSTDSALLQTERTITALGLAKSATQMIPAKATVIVARGATTGRMVFLGCEMAMNQTCYALTSKRSAPSVLYCLLKQKVSSLLNAAHGSVFDTITTNTFLQSRVVHPPQVLTERFEDAVGPLFERIITGTEAARYLTETRDTLLPRLISGKLRLQEALERIAA